jgi:hypothetical protein
VLSLMLHVGDTALTLKLACMLHVGLKATLMLLMLLIVVEGVNALI